MEDNWDLHAVVRGCATIASTTSSVSSSFVSSVSSSSVFSTTSSSLSSSSSSSCGFNSMMILPSTTTTTTSQQKSNLVFSFSSNPFEARNSIDEELHELWKPFFLKSQPNNNNDNNHFHHSFQASSCCSSTLSSSSSSSFSYSSSPNSVQPQQKQSSKHPHHAGSAITTPRSKRRKNQLKKVCQVSAENLSSDIWAWRKYGQKPIKGSPYPRGYYRCSSSKGCLARKQVERNRTDPTMFIVTYTGEHNHPAPTHRNSLAGSTRQKTQISANEDTENKALMITKQQASPSTSCVEEEGGEEEEEEELVGLAAQKSESELEDNMEDFLMTMSNDDNDNNNEINDVFGSPDVEITDDFFEGLDELTVVSSSSSGECFSVSAIPSLVAK